MLAPLLAAISMNQSSYHGFVQHDFEVAGRRALLVEPKKAAPGRPWIWRMEFFDHRPETDLALLNKGYHLGYVDVGNTFGAPLPTFQLSSFYREVTEGKFKLNPRVVLEGLSRGGLYAYNWAIHNPDKVAVIYGDAPVCDFTTWPYTKSPSDWDALKKAYGFPNDKLALGYAFQPVRTLEPLAAAKVPIIHVIGDADEVVAVEPNTGLLEKNYRKLGGTIHVIHKPGGLHHPHGLDDPTPIVRFIESHFNDSLGCAPSTCIPAPNLETRSRSAGWGDRSWIDMHLTGIRSLRAAESPVVILGDSIVQGLAASAEFRGELAPLGWLGLGLSGDRTQNILWRLDHGILAHPKVRAFVVMIGINNAADDSPEMVVRGIQAIVNKIRAGSPESKIYVMPLVSPGKDAKDPTRRWTTATNRKLSSIDGASICQAPVGFILPNGETNFELVSRDGIHLTAKGSSEIVRELKICNSSSN